MGKIRLNVYGAGPTGSGAKSLTGHSNITFIENGIPVVTIGATINSAKRRIGIISSTLGEFDGIYQNELTLETGRPGASVILDVDDATYSRVKAWATSQVGKHYNYGLFTDACNHFVQKAYEVAGFTGGYGAQFSFEDVLKNQGFIWSNIPDAPKFILGRQHLPWQN